MKRRQIARIFPCAALGAWLAACSLPAQQQAQPSTQQQAGQSHPTMAEVIEKSQPSDWRPLDDDNTLYVELASGRVIVELAPAFAPRYVENIRTLAREGYYDGLWIVRSQDNYVAQWADPDDTKKPVKGQRTLRAEFARELSSGVPFTRLPDGDVYAPEVGFSAGFPVARDVRTNRMWLAHCYAMIGAGRDNDPDSGGGTELYVVNGHSPRHLDRNVTLVGRVVKGMELLSSLPRGTQPMGYYETAAGRTQLRSVRVASDVPASERTPLEAMRTDTPAFEALVESRRNRPEPWFHERAGRIELCNVPLPVRPR